MKSIELFFIILLACSYSWSAEVSITMDDPATVETPLLTWAERNDRILKTLAKYDLQATLFVCGKRIDSEDGKKLLKAWDKNNHWIANHSYSHSYFHSDKLSLQDFSDDMMKAEPLIANYKNFKRLFRFPMLKEGNTLEKRDGMRKFLKDHNYINGYVTIDASDWYISDRLIAKLKENPKADISKYRDFYLKHIWDRSTYYDNLSKKVLGGSMKHTLLVHHNLLNALFLEDILKMYKEKGWKLISAKKAYADAKYQVQPDILPAGEGLVWALAKETKKYDSELRYPGEDSEYEKAEMDKLGL